MAQTSVADGLRNLQLHHPTDKEVHYRSYRDDMFASILMLAQNHAQNREPYEEQCVVLTTKDMVKAYQDHMRFAHRDTILPLPHGPLSDDEDKVKAVVGFSRFVQEVHAYFTGCSITVMAGYTIKIAYC